MKCNLCPVKDECEFIRERVEETQKNLALDCLILNTVEDKVTEFVGLMASYNIFLEMHSRVREEPKQKEGNGFQLEG